MASMSTIYSCFKQFVVLILINCDYNCLYGHLLRFCSDICRRSQIKHRFSSFLIMWHPILYHYYRESFCIILNYLLKRFEFEYFFFHETITYNIWDFVNSTIYDWPAVTLLHANQKTVLFNDACVKRPGDFYQKGLEYSGSENLKNGIITINPSNVSGSITIFNNCIYSFTAEVN